MVTLIIGKKGTGKTKKLINLAAEAVAASKGNVVVIEKLNMRSMANRSFGNGKATLDNGYGMLLNMLEYKLSDRNKYLVKVDKWFPSS